MATRTKGRWAQGIQPRNFSWVIKDRLAVCERPGGFGANHRRVRRQEEIIWLREQGFGMVISLLSSPHNLHNYEELGLPYLHRPFLPAEDNRPYLVAFYPELHRLVVGGTKTVVHADEVGERLVGLLGGYIRWTGMVPDGAQAIELIERITGRQLDPFGRNLVAVAGELRQAMLARDAVAEAEPVAAAGPAGAATAPPDDAVDSLPTGGNDPTGQPSSTPRRRSR